MAIPGSKQELLQAIRSSYQKLTAELSGVPAGRTREATLEGHAKGTRMSVADLLGYLIGWNLLVLKWNDGRAQGLAVDFPETDYGWNELGRLAQQFYADHADVPYAELLERLADAQRRILELVEAGSEASLYGCAWYKHYSLGRMIQFNSASPYANARQRLRVWKRAQGLLA